MQTQVIKSIDERNKVANVIAALLTYTACVVQWPSFPLFYCMTCAWPDNVIRPRPLRPSASWRGVSWTGVGRRWEFGEISCTEYRGQGNDFELISTVKIETRHPVQGSFGSEFLAICNQAELPRPEVARR